MIGRGAIGIVYKGYDEQIDRPLAIKTLRPEILHDVDDRTDFLRRVASGWAQTKFSPIIKIASVPGSAW